MPLEGVEWALIGLAALLWAALLFFIFRQPRLRRFPPKIGGAR